MIKKFDTYYYATFNALLYATISVMFVFLAILLKHNGFSNAEIGLFLGVNYIGTFLSPLLFVKYHFNLSSVKFFLFVLFLSVLLLAMSQDSFWYVLIIMFIFGFSRNVVQTYLETTTARVFEKNYGIIRGVGSFGFLLMTFAVGKFFSLDVLVGVLYGLSAAYLLFFLTFSLKHKSVEMESESWDFSIITMFKYFWAFIFVFHVAMGMLFSFLTIYLTDRGYDMAEVSLVWNVSVIAEVILFFTFVIFKDKMDKYHFVTFSIIATIFRLILLYVYPEVLWVVLFAQAMHMFSFVVFHMSLMEIIAEIMHKRFKMGIKTYFSVGYGLSLGVGSFLGGVVYSDEIFLYAAFVLILGLFLWFEFVRRESGLKKSSS